MADPYYSNVSLLLHCDGSNGGTTFTDNGPNALTVTANSNAVTSTTRSVAGTASMTSNSGTAAYLTVSDQSFFAFPGQFTVECWVYQTSATAMDILQTGTDGASGWAFYIRGATSSPSISNGSTNTLLPSDKTVPLDTWTHVAWTRDASNVVRAFVNGQVSSTTVTDSTSITATAAGSTKIGATYYGNGVFNTTSWMDELRVTKGVCRYTSNFTVPTAPFDHSNDVTGDLAATEAQDTSTINATAVATVTGTFALVEAEDIAAMSGSVGSVVSGTFDNTEAADTFAMAGTYGDDIVATFALTEDPDTMTAYGGSLTAGEKVFVTVGSSGVMVKGTIDGDTWTSLSSPTGSGLYSIKYADNLWVAVGEGGTIVTSPDLSTWTTRTSGTSGIIYSVDYGDGKWVACGGSGKVMTSTDGATWTVATTSPAVALWRIRYFGGQWIIASSGNRVFTSTDAVTWTSRTIAMASTAVVRGIAYDGSTYVITGGVSGSAPKINTSSDGATWTARTFPSSLAGKAYSVTHNGSLFIAPWNDGGSNTPKRITATGSTWTSTATLPTGTTALNDIINAEGLSVIVGASGYIATGASTTFTKKTSPVANEFRGITQGQLPATGGYVYGPLAATEAADTCTINLTRLATFSGDLAATEAADFFELSGASFATIGGSIDATEAPDDFILAVVRDYADITIDMATTEAQDTIACTGTVLALTGTKVVRIGAVESPDTTSIRLSTTVSGNMTLTESPDVFTMTTAGAVGGIIMTVQILDATWTNIVTHGASLFDAGLLRIYSGAQPALPSDEPTGVLLGEIELPDVAFIEDEDQLGRSVNSEEWEGAATSSGTAGWFRLISEDGLNVIDGSVSSSYGTGNMLMSATNLTIGDPLVVKSCFFEFLLADEV